MDFKQAPSITGSMMIITTKSTRFLKVFSPRESGVVRTLRADYFDIVNNGSLSGFIQNEVNLLRVHESVEQPNAFRDFHPIVQRLDGLVLDDPDTSNHHVYLSRPPFAGNILFLSHDDATRIVFPSLTDFLRTARTAKETQRWLGDLHPT